MKFSKISDLDESKLLTKVKNRVSPLKVVKELNYQNRGYRTSGGQMTLVLLFRLSVFRTLCLLRLYYCNQGPSLHRSTVHLLWFYSLSPKSLYKVRGLCTVRSEVAFVLRSLRVDGGRTATNLRNRRRRPVFLFWFERKTFQPFMPTTEGLRNCPQFYYS